MSSPSSAPTASLTDKQFVEDKTTPRWIKDILQFLSVKSQFILFGNIRDIYPFPALNAQFHQLSFPSYLASALKLRGYERFILFDFLDGFTAIVSRGERLSEAREFFQKNFKIAFDEKTGRWKCDLNRSLEVFAELVACDSQSIAIFADFASRYVLALNNLQPEEHEYFTKALKLSHSANAHFRNGRAQFNSIFWLCDKENDLPSWLSFDNSRVRSVPLPRPDHVLREALISSLIKGFAGFADTKEADRKAYLDVFVDQTEGMVLSDVVAITQICRNDGLGLPEIGEAVRRYKIGVTEDPWKKIDRSRIESGRAFIHRRVKGQQQATEKALDIIKRATTGLSGSQGSKANSRPRGVLFLAGPTGVGKTELAKAITELLFKDERAYIRFDMSEFGAEHADQRLLGAPPGYIGYDSGGELTNAIREKPFSVVLFDEIEKAHPRILDKFLQMLDEGVLTSGRGERVYFSEAIIIFTSNLGIYRDEHEDGFARRVPNVSADKDDYESVATKVRAEIDVYFKNKLNRPEILNRIGENIVVFDFIRPEVAGEIYDKMIENILARLADRQKIEITLTREVESSLKGRCLADLSNGGRGIGNQLEAWFINPLARALFDKNIASGSKLRVTAIDAVESVPTVSLENAG